MLFKCSGKYIDIYFILKITFSGVSDHSRENSVNDKKNESKFELDVLKNKRAITFSKKLLFVIFAIDASARAWERRNDCLGLGANGLKD